MFPSDRKRKKATAAIRASPKKETLTPIPTWAPKLRPLELEDTGGAEEAEVLDVDEGFGVDVGVEVELELVETVATSGGGPD